jgi:hypothetical protein
MVEAKPRRGRPIGTGIDDSGRIARLAELLKSQPELKPTTAIRAMGFSNPSTIRRLRDKYKAFRKSALGFQGPSTAGSCLSRRKSDAVFAVTASQPLR